MGDAELPKPATQGTVVGNMAKGAESMPGLHASTRGCYSPWPCDCIRLLHGPHLNQTAVLIVLRCYTHSPRCRWTVRYGCVRFTAHRHRLITKSRRCSPRFCRYPTISKSGIGKRERNQYCVLALFRTPASSPHNALHIPLVSKPISQIAP